MIHPVLEVRLQQIIPREVKLLQSEGEKDDEEDVKFLKSSKLHLSLCLFHLLFFMIVLSEILKI